MMKFLSILFLFYCAGLQAQETKRIYLSGKGSDDAVNWKFFCTAGMNSGKWTTIPVPSCWELQGFGKYDYGFAKDSVRGKEEGLYGIGFEAPAGWENHKVNIVFEGSMTDTEVKVNGQLAGEVHQGSFYTFRYDITSLLRSGSNMLEVKVAKHSANQSVNEAERKADYWIFGGIYRPVYLELLPRDHIEQVAVDARADGSFSAKIKVQGKADMLSLQLYDKKGAPAGSPVTVKINPNAGEAIISTSFKNMLQWTPESPNLYKAVFTLSKGGKVQHKVIKKTGFRTVHVKQRDGIYVNGVKVKMKGVNRHSFRPNTGRTTSRRISIEDVLLIKNMNMNAVRMSHYPPDDHFLDVCDSLGLFVMNELAGWHGNYDTKTGARLLKAMINESVNHPSIVFWANGNEGGHNTDLDSLFYQYDIQKRPLIHPWEAFGGFDTQHYREYNYGIGNYDHGHHIIMPTEFLHGWFDGGHGAGLEDYWDMMWRRPLSAGGFLWDLADQGVVRTDKNGQLDTDAHRGADGIVGPHHEKEGSYYAIKEIWSPVFIEPREITSAFDGVLNIENRYHYTNLRACTFSYKLARLHPNKTETAVIPVKSPTLAPLEKGRLKLDLPANWNTYDVLYVTARDSFRRELFTWSFPVVHPAGVTRKMLPRSTGRIQLNEQDSLYRVATNSVEIAIHKRTGLLQEVKSKGQLIPFSNGPIVQEGVNNFRNITHRLTDSALIIESAFDRKNGYNTLRWTVYPGGLLKLEVHYFPSAYFTSMAGVNFSFPEKDIRSVQYMGYGPYRVWKNRMKGNAFGVWSKEYNSTETGEAPWVYPEFKGYHANMYWCKFITAGRPFMVMTDNEDLFLRLFTPAFKTDQWKNYEPTFPSGDISFMQGITSIGSKTQRNETTGPMGMKNIYYDYEKDPRRHLSITLYFNFDLDE